MASQPVLLISDEATEPSVTRLETVQAPAPMNPHMAMITAAITSGSDIAVLERLMGLQERYEQGEARKAFTAAMAAFKGEAVRVAKDKDNHQYKSKYVSLGNLIDTVTPALSRHGLSAHWEIEQATGICVTCHLTHAAGHSVSVSMTCPPDKSGAKNAIQEIKSAITYAKACTFESVCGLASTDANLDDDGNGFKPAAPKPGAPPPITQDALLGHIKSIGEAGNLQDLQVAFSLGIAAANGDRAALDNLISAKDKRKLALQKVS